MGNWNITIEGVGPHHNGGKSFDADKMAIDFVSKLKAEGHTIRHASFTYGAATDIAFRQVTEDEWRDLEAKK